MVSDERLEELAEILERLSGMVGILTAIKGYAGDVLQASYALRDLAALRKRLWQLPRHQIKNSRDGLIVPVLVTLPYIMAADLDAALEVDGETLET